MGTLADEALTYYNSLFHWEHEFAEMIPQDRYKARLEQTKKLLEALEKWLKKTQKIVMATSGLGEAIKYTLTNGTIWWPL